MQVLINYAQLMMFEPAAPQNSAGGSSSRCADAACSGVPRTRQQGGRSARANQLTAAIARAAPAARAALPASWMACLRPAWQTWRCCLLRLHEHTTSIRSQSRSLLPRSAGCRTRENLPCIDPDAAVCVEPDAATPPARPAPEWPRSLHKASRRRCRLQRHLAAQRHLGGRRHRHSVCWVQLPVVNVVRVAACAMGQTSQNLG